MFFLCLRLCPLRQHFFSVLGSVCCIFRTITYLSPHGICFYLPHLSPLSIPIQLSPPVILISHLFLPPFSFPRPLPVCRILPHPLSLAHSLKFSFPLKLHWLHLSTESLNGDKAYTSLLDLHPPSPSRALHPSSPFSIPYIHTFNLPRL